VLPRQAQGGEFANFIVITTYILYSYFTTWGLCLRTHFFMSVLLFAIWAFITWKWTNRGDKEGCVLGCGAICSGRNLTPFQECNPSIFLIYTKWKQNVPRLHGVAFQKAVFFMFWRSAEIHVMQFHVYSSFENTATPGEHKLVKNVHQTSKF